MIECPGCRALAVKLARAACPKVARIVRQEIIDHERGHR